MKSLTLSNVPFKNGEYTHGGIQTFESLSRSSIQSDPISTNLKQQIVSNLKMDIEAILVVVETEVEESGKISISKGVELISLLYDSEKRMNVSEIVIEEGCGNELNDGLWLCGLEHLKKLIVKKNSLKNLNYLVISNNNELESIVIEDGQNYDKENDTWYAAFENVKSVEVSSLSN